MGNIIAGFFSNFTERDFTKTPLTDEEIDVLVEQIPKDDIIGSLNQEDKKMIMNNYPIDDLIQRMGQSDKEKIVRAMSSQKIFNIRGDSVFDYYFTNNKQELKNCMRGHINQNDTSCEDEKFKKMITTIPNLVLGPLREKQSQWDSDKEKWNTEKTTLQSQWDSDKEKWNTEKQSLQSQWDSDKEKWNTEKQSLQSQWNTEKTALQSQWNTEKTALQSQWDSDKEKWNTEKTTLQSQWDSDKEKWNTEKTTLQSQWNSDKEKWNTEKTTLQSQWDSDKEKWNTGEKSYEKLKKWTIKDCTNKIPFEYYKTNTGKPSTISRDECENTKYHPYRYEWKDEINDSRYPVGCFVKGDYHDIYFNTDKDGGKQDCSSGKAGEKINCLKKRKNEELVKECSNFGRNLHSYLGRKINRKVRCQKQSPIANLEVDGTTVKGREKCAEAAAKKLGDHYGVSIDNSKKSECHACLSLESWTDIDGKDYSTFLINNIDKPKPLLVNSGLGSLQTSLTQEDCKKFADTNKYVRPSNWVIDNEWEVTGCSFATNGNVVRFNTKKDSPKQANSRLLRIEYPQLRFEEPQKYEDKKENIIDKITPIESEDMIKPLSIPQNSMSSLIRGGNLGIKINSGNLGI